MEMGWKEVMHGERMGMYGEEGWGCVEREDGVVRRWSEEVMHGEGGRG